MGKIEESRINHGKIDLTHVIKPIIECLQQGENSLLKEHEGKIYVMTDKIIRSIIDNKTDVNGMRKEGHLFSDLYWASAVATLHKNAKAADNQMKQIAHLEEVIYDRLQSLLSESEKKADFFGQSASSYFDALTALAGKKNEIGTTLQSAVFPDAQLLKEYPGTKAILRVPRHTIQMKGELSYAFVKAVKQVMKKRLSREEIEEDEIDAIIRTLEKGLDDNTSQLSPALKVFDENAYGRIRRTYACSVLEKMVPALENNSPAISYIRRVSDFNELVQYTLPDSGLSAEDFVLEFPNYDGGGTMNFDLMIEFSRADALNKLPFWFSFSELLFEKTKTENITTTLGQHFKMNGQVMSEGFDSVFEFHVNKLTTMANLLKEEARAKGEGFPDESEIRKALRIAVLYYVVFRNDPDMPRSALANYKAFKKQVTNWVASKVGLDEILTQIAKLLSGKTTIDNNSAIRQAFKKLLQSRQPENFPPKQKLYLTISRDILNNTAGMKAGNPIVPVPSQQYDTSYLRYLTVTRFSSADSDALLKEEIRFTESLRYLTLPKNNQVRNREMNREIDRNVLGVLFTPKDNEMRYFALPFKTFTNLIISYDRNQINGTQFAKDDYDYLTGLARLIYVLLVYGVLKAVERLEREYQQSLLETTDDNSLKHANRTMMLMLSLFPDEEKHFTHDAHKAIEHIIRQHMPTKSQGFRLTRTKSWDNQVIQSQDIKKTAIDFIEKELKDYRATNIIGGLSSGLDALWHLPDEPSLKKVALIVVTSRACDKTRQDSEIADRKVMFGEIHRFEHETQHDELGTVKHFYRHQPVEAFCDDMDAADSFKNPSVLFSTIRQLDKEDYRDVIVVTKVPFTRRIRMTTDENTAYTNPKIIQELSDEMPKLRIYPLFTQKSSGVRLPPKQPKQPMFIPHDPNYEWQILDESDNTLFRAASVLTNRIVGKEDDRMHSGITDYLFRWYPETAPIQSQAMAALTSTGKDQACLHEILRFLHANAFEQVIGNKKNALDAKLDALESIIGDGDENIGHQANSLKFPKPKTGSNKGPNDKTHYFSINMIALLKHLENQSEQHRKKRVSVNNDKD